MIVLVSGATGFIGSATVEALRRRGDSVLQLVRPPRGSGVGEVLWRPGEGFIDAAALGGCDAVIHLAGESLDGRWTEAKKRRVLESRLKSSRLLVECIGAMERRPKVLVSASGVNYYGARGDEALDEDTPAGEGFLPDVARQWEAACREAEAYGVRTVQMRFGVVLSARGGALAKMLPAFSLYLGGPFGSGRQCMPWVSLEDAVAAILFAVDRGDLSGPVNVVSPGAVTNEEFSRTLAASLGRRCFLRVPAFALRLVFGQLADELLLSGSRPVPRKLLEAGFGFRHPELAECLKATLGEKG